VPDVAALLAEPGIDLVVVASPDALHAEHAIAALEAGKHVLIDKPFAASLADARRIAEAVEAAGKQVTVFQNRRWDADFRTLQRLIAEGALGDIVQFESHFDRWRPTPTGLWKEAREGGAWLDLGPHLVDQAVVLFGRPEGISLDLATMRDGAPSPDYFHAVLRYERRRVILHATKLTAQHRLRFAVHGTRASWIKHGSDPQEAATLAGRAPEGEDWGLGDDGATSPAPNERGDYRLFWRALAAAIRGEGANPVPTSQAITVMEVLDAGLRSAADRAEVAF
jgi:predicted dehydrogenase